ncbi:6093_t:CDS:1, partial [Funneliformis geosporum]
FSDFTSNIIKMQGDIFKEGTKANYNSIRIVDNSTIDDSSTKYNDNDDDSIIEDSDTETDSVDSDNFYEANFEDIMIKMIENQILH